MTAATTARQLSRAYAANLYRASRLAPARYVPFSGKATCDECGARQHETRGQLTEGGGVRAPARTRRTIAGDPERALLLCHEHVQLWQARDVDDVSRSAR
jgi:hypothetical protein